MSIVFMIERRYDIVYPPDLFMMNNIQHEHAFYLRNASIMLRQNFAGNRYFRYNGLVHL